MSETTGTNNLDTFILNEPSSPQILYCKTRDVKSPARAHPTDAGIDFFFPNQFTEADLKKSTDTTGTPLYSTGHGNLVIPPFGSLLISSGTKWIIPDGYALVFFNKSGVASKKHLIIGACVTANTIIETNKGKFTASTLTKEFIEENNIKVLSYNFAKKQNEFCEFDGFRIVKQSKCIRVTFDDGTIIEGDENHCIYIDNKWIALKDL